MGAVLSQPAYVQVRADPLGAPAAVRTRNGWTAVEKVMEQWDLEDDWWTGEPIARTYFQLLLKSGAVVTVFREAATGAWYRQRA